MSSSRSSTPLSRELVDAHGPWFQTFHIDGIDTAPGHPLGNYPDAYFRRFAHALPADLTGWSMLDIGCNAGFYAFEMKRRGAARVVGIDTEPLYLVLLMGALDHLRHPRLAVDLLRQHAVRRCLVFQSTLRGSSPQVPWAADYPFAEKGRA